MDCEKSLVMGLNVLLLVFFGVEVDGLGCESLVMGLTVLLLVFFAAEVDGSGCGKSPVMGRRSEACFVTSRCLQRFEL